jgi:hypothetical protein
MIRFVVGLFIFAVLLCAYIVSKQPTPYARVAPEVVRNDATADETPAEATPEVVETVVTAPTQPLPFRTTRDPLTLTVANVLIGLNLAPTHLNATGARGPESALEILVLQAIQARIADQNISAMVTEAALAGGLLVPDVLVTADRKIDTQALLDEIISQAAVTADGQPPAAQVAPVGIVWIGENAFYTVIETDSLARIAAYYLGSALHADQLFAANANVMQAADQIMAGQTLLLPSN